MRGGTSVIVSLWLVLGAAACVPAPRLSGPPTDHFTDGSFRNLARFDPPGITDLLEWAVTGDAVTWPEWVEIPDARPPPARVTQGLRVTFVNHATVLVQMSGVNVLTDPVWSERVGPAFWIGPRRHKDPGIRFEDLPPIDAIVISHNHYDHLDGPTIARVVERDMPVVLAGLGTEKLLAELGIAFIAVPVSRDLRSFGRPRVVSRGFVGAADEDRLLDEAEEHVRRELIQHRDDFDDAEDVRDRAARSLKRFLGQRLSRKPLVTVVTVPHA